MVVDDHMVLEAGRVLNPGWRDRSDVRGDRRQGQKTASKWAGSSKTTKMEEELRDAGSPPDAGVRP